MIKSNPTVSSLHFQEKIEILSVDLLEQNRALVEELKTFARTLHLEFGWHYLLDLSWTIQQLGDVQAKIIMDAGAGTGILQWYLAQNEAMVYSVDRSSRSSLPLRFRNRFRARGLRESDLLPAGQALFAHFKRPARGHVLRRFAGQSLAAGRDLLSFLGPKIQAGSVLIYNQDLSRLTDIPADSMDAAVAISALEHNTPEGLEQVVKEIMRVLKPGGALLATLTAGRDQDWWHVPSNGWCYTETSLRRIFDLPESVPSNYDRYDDMFRARCAILRSCAKIWLASTASQPR